MNEKIIERIEEFLRGHKISKTDLANKAGVSKSYISMLMKNERAINIEVLQTLSGLSGKSMNWWLHGKDEYLNLQSLSDLIDTFIEMKYIKEDGSMEHEYRQMLNMMLDKEIKVKLNKIKNKNKK